MGMFFGLTLYACTTKTDFTMMGGFLWTFLWVMIIASIFMIFTQSNVAHIVYDAIGVLLFSLYIIYDT